MSKNKSKTIFSSKVLLSTLSFLVILQILSNHEINSFAKEGKNNVMRPSAKLSEDFPSQPSAVKQQTNVIKKIETIAQVPNVPSGTFNYGGSICFAALVREGFHSEIEKAHPSFELNYVEPIDRPGCGAEIEPLLEGNLSFLFNTRSLSSEEYKLAKTQGINLISIPLAIDSVAVYSHKSLSRDFLTLQQLRDIYLGTITNWQEVGGEDIPIIPVSLYPHSNTDLQVLMQLDSKGVRQLDLNNSTVFVRDYTSAIKLVANTLGAISLTSAAILKEQNSVKPLALAKSNDSIPVSIILADGSINLKAFSSNIYPLTRELSIVFRNDSSLSSEAGFAYSNFLQSQQGYKFLEKAGFAPISSFRN